MSEINEPAETSSQIKPEADNLSPFEPALDFVFGQAFTNQRFAKIVLERTGCESVEKLAQKVEEEREKAEEPKKEGEAEKPVIPILRQLYEEFSVPIHDERSDKSK